MIGNQLIVLLGYVIIAVGIAGLCALMWWRGRR